MSDLIHQRHFYVDLIPSSLALFGTLNAVATPFRWHVLTL
jgi:hypothetical protein